MNTNKNWVVSIQQAIQEATKHDSETIFKLSTERAQLRALVARLFDGIDDHWRTLPENAEAFEAAKKIHDMETRNV